MGDRPALGLSEDIEQIGPYTGAKLRGPFQAAVVMKLRRATQHAGALVLNAHQVEQGKAIVTGVDKQIDIALFIGRIACDRAIKKQARHPKPSQFGTVAAEAVKDISAAHRISYSKDGARGQDGAEPTPRLDRPFPFFTRIRVGSRTRALIVCAPKWGEITPTPSLGGIAQ